MNRHEPALDGLRGLAVLGVVLFHAGFSWAVGGFLGVSTFFTLSGFLITSLLLRERSVSGRIDLVAFWGRRARRLLPASLATLVVVAGLAPLLGTPSQLASLRGDVLGALLYVANWRFLFDSRSYADLFSAPSPLLHFWSLAIEEQLYVLFPLVVVAVGARRRLLPWVLGGLVALSVGLSFVLFSGQGSSTDAAYYSTFVRGGELFVGALLAVLATPGRHMWRPGVAKTSGVVALALLVWAWSTVRQDSVELYRGGFVVHAVLSAVVILAAVQPGGVVRVVLSLPPLTALGRISYGVYLYHWPVLVWWDAPLLVQLGLTLVLAVVSYVVLEQPIRQRRVRVPLAVVPAAFVLVGGVAVASTLDPPRVETFALAPTPPPLPSDPMVEPAPDAPRVAVFGDSTALRTAFALKGWGWTTGRIDMRDGGADVGCPLARAGAVDFVVARQDPEPHCNEWPTTWAAASSSLDAAVVQIGPWDVTDRELDDGSWTHIGTPEFDALLRSEMSRAVDVLSAGGARVIWVTAPHIDFGRGQAGLPRDHPINEPARIDRLNELIASLDAARPEMVVLDLAAYLRSLPGGEMDPALRPDGVHFSEEASAELVDWLGPALLELIDR